MTTATARKDKGPCLARLTLGGQFTLVTDMRITCCCELPKGHETLHAVRGRNSDGLPYRIEWSSNEEGGHDG